MQSLPLLLGEVPDAVRETVRNFALKEVAPRAQEPRGAGRPALRVAGLRLQLHL